MAKHNILFVDDEVNVLNALERAFLIENEIKVFIANTAQEGVKILEQEKINLVVSDEKMPVVQGHKFLNYIKNKYPDIIRIILTGYADANAIIESINQGEVYRYLKKPWDNNELKIIIRKALEYSDLKKKNEEMQKIIKQQNRDLRLFNLDLENNITERTDQLKKALLTLKLSIKDKNYFWQMAELYILIISLIHKELSKYTQRIVESVKKLCDELPISNEEKDKILLAAYVHDIGLLNISHEYFTLTNSAGMTEEQRRIYFEHPLIGSHLIKPVKELEEVADIILAHHENYDGTGFPARKWGDKLPLGAKIIRIVSEFDSLLTTNKQNILETLEVLQKKEKQFDPELLAVFIKQVEKDMKLASDLGFETTLSNLKSGMLIQEDIFLNNKMLLFVKGKMIDEEVLKKINTLTPLLNMEKNILVRYLQKS
jgi:response regulator RpfG family c-di-GMP phosphodiesterase